MKSVDRWCKAIEDHDLHSINARGNSIYRRFLSDQRYVIDFASEFVNEGWMQFDTDQDAEYFGVWVNPRTLTTLTYAEGDWTLVRCFSKESYLDEIRDAIRVYREGFEFKSLDTETGEICEYRQDRSKFLVVE